MKLTDEQLAMCTSAYGRVRPLIDWSTGEYTSKYAIRIKYHRYCPPMSPLSPYDSSARVVYSFIPIEGNSLYIGQLIPLKDLCFKREGVDIIALFNK